MEQIVGSDLQKGKRRGSWWVYLEKEKKWELVEGEIVPSENIKRAKIPTDKPLEAIIFSLAGKPKKTQLLGLYSWRKLPFYRKGIRDVYRPRPGGEASWGKEEIRQTLERERADLLGVELRFQPLKYDFLLGRLKREDEINYVLGSTEKFRGFSSFEKYAIMKTTLKVFEVLPEELGKGFGEKSFYVDKLAEETERLFESYREGF